MGLFDFFKGKSSSEKKPKTVYDELSNILKEGSKNSNSGLQFYRFAYVHLPRLLFENANNSLVKIYSKEKEEVVTEFTKSCLSSGTMPKSSDIEKISINFYESKHTKIVIINFPQIENATHNGLPILPPIKIGIAQDTESLRYFIVGNSLSSGSYTLREVSSNMTNSNLGPASGLSDDAFLSDINSKLEPPFEIQIKEVLRSSLGNLTHRQGGLTLQDFETEIIYQASKFLIKNFRDDLKTVHDINLINTVLPDNKKFQQIIKIFIEAGTEMLPEQYTNEHQEAAYNAIYMNISWSGMWDHLRDYFQKKHGIAIDSIKAEPLIFYSIKHTRFENNEVVSQDDVERNININFFNEKEKIIVSIEPTLSAKTAFISEKNDKAWTYIGEDPDYKFIIYLDKFEEVDKFILELPNRNLKIIYT